MLFLISIPLALTMVGCSPGLGTEPVTGVVTFNGEAVELANVMFMRSDETGGPAAIAVTDSDGKFELKTSEYDGAVPGQYSVTVQKDTSVYMDIPDPLPEGYTKSRYMRKNKLIPQPLLPLKFGSITETPLKYTVQEDEENHFEIKLVGKKPAARMVPLDPALP